MIHLLRSATLANAKERKRKKTKRIKNKTDPHPEHKFPFFVREVEIVPTIWQGD